MTTRNINTKSTISCEGFSALFDVLKEKGYTIVGPTISQGAIVYDELNAVQDLPSGWTDLQDGGSYRLKEREDKSFFGFNVGPHSWKKYLFPPNHLLWQAKRKNNGFELMEDAQKETPKYVFLGVRACELHAMEIQDKIFIKGEHIDLIYHVNREKALIIAVNCAQAGGTCFCTSMNTGPKVNTGFDLALTEIVNEKLHYFLVEVGSELGAEIINLIPNTKAGIKEVDTADQIIKATASSMGRVMDTNGLKELLYESHDSEVWDEIATRCLSCGNCTMVCPTCFCSTVEDVTDLTGDTAERWRSWDSCFNIDFSYIHGGSVRTSVQSRYRQWITHKLASWIDQFGTSGCVGCGRCITWCPVAIDITKEVDVLRQSNANNTRHDISIPE